MKNKTMDLEVTHWYNLAGPDWKRSKGLIQPATQIEFGIPGLDHHTAFIWSRDPCLRLGSADFERENFRL